MRTLFRWVVYLVLMGAVGYGVSVALSKRASDAPLPETAMLPASSAARADSPSSAEGEATEEGEEEAKEEEAVEDASGDGEPLPPPPPVGFAPARSGGGAGGGAAGGGGIMKALEPVIDESDPFAAADAALAKLKPANIAFNTPEAISLGQTADVQLLLSMQETIETLTAAVSAAGRKDGAEVKVSNTMEAKLTGGGFAITAVTPEMQIVTRTGRTEWKWQVVPVEAGAHRLFLTLSAHVTIDGERVPRVIKTFERSMDVEVSWSHAVVQFASGNWEWLWTTLLIPVGGEVLRRRKKGNSPSGSRA